MGTNCSIDRMTIGQLFPNVTKRERYVNLMNSLVGDIIRDYLSDSDYYIEDVTKKDFIDEVYTKSSALLSNVIALKNGYTTYEDGTPIELPFGMTTKTLPTDEVLDDIYDILENYNTFANYHQAVTPLFKFNGFNYNDLKSDNIESNIDSFVSDEIAEEPGASEEERSLKIDEYDRTINESDSYQDLHPHVKFVFNILSSEVYNPQTGNFDLVLDTSNLPLSAPATNIYNRVISKINNLEDERLLLAAFQNPDTHKVIPELRQINKILNLDNWNDRTLKQKDLWNNFWREFSKPYINIQSMTEKKEKGEMIREMNSDIKGNSQKIKDRWASNFETKNINPKLAKAIEEGEETTAYAEKSKLIVPSSVETAYNFLEQLGMTFSRSLFEDEARDEINEIVLDHAKIIHRSLEAIVKNPINFLNKGRTWAYLTRLVQIEGRYSQENPSNSSITALGERQYAIANKTNMSLTRTNLNSATDLEDLLTKNTFTNLAYNPLYKRSATLKRLFDENWQRDSRYELSFNVFSGQFKNGRGKMMRDFTPKDKLIFDFESMIRFGRSDVMRPETSNTFFSVGLTRKGNYLYSSANEMPYFPIDVFKAKVFENQEVRDQFLDYLAGEVERIKSYPAKKKENPTLTADYGEFNIFAGLPNELKAEILASAQVDGEVSIATFISDDLKNRFFTEYGKVITKEFFKLSNELDRIPAEELYSRNVKALGFDEMTLKKAFFMNSLVQNIEFTILFSGDPLFFNRKSEFHKRNKQLSSPGTYTNVNSSANDVVAGNENLRNTNLSQLVGVPLRDNSKTFLSRVINDIKASEIDGFYAPYLADGSDFEVSDGQGIISPDFLQELLLRQGFRNEYTDKVFEYEHLIAKKHLFKDGQWSEQDELKLTKLQLLIEESPDMYALPVNKGGYSGPIVNSTVDGRVYDKFSLKPLLPSYALGKPKLEKLLKDMLEKQYGYIKYDTGSKGFKTKSVDYDKLSTGTPDQLVTSLFKTQIAYSNEQSVDTSIPTQMVKLIMSNQFNNGEAIDNEAKALYDDYIDVLSEIQKSQRQKLMEEFGIADGKVNYEVLSKKLLKEAMNRGMNSNILNALVYNPETQRLNINGEITIPTEIEKLITSIADKTLRRYKLNGGDYVMISNALSPRLKFYEDGVNESCECRISMSKEFTKLLNLRHPDKQRIGNRIRLNEAIKDEKWRKQHIKYLTIVLDRVPTQELNSMESAQIVEFLPSTMGNVIQLPEEIVVKAGSDFDYDKEKVIIPSYSKSGKYIDSKFASSVMDNSNEILKKIEELDRNQAVEDNLPAIKDYIAKNADLIDPEYFEEIVLADDEGAIEQMKTVLANLVYYRSYLENSTDDSAVQTVSDITEIIGTMDEYFTRDGVSSNKVRVKELFKFSTDIQDYFDSKRMLDMNSNRILELYSNAILKKDRFSELVKKNDVTEIKQLSKFTGDHIGVSTAMPNKDKVFYPWDNWNVFNTFFNAKKMLAPYAKMNTLQQLFVYAGTKLNTSVVDKYGKAIELEHKLETPQGIQTIQDAGILNAGSNYDLDGVLKQLINSQSINATVDAAKDPYFASLMLNYKNIGVDTFLGSVVGIPQKTIKAFLTNKGLLEIVQKMNDGSTPRQIREFIIRRYGLGRYEKVEMNFKSMKKYQEFIKNAPTDLQIINQGGQKFKLMPDKSVKVLVNNFLPISARAKTFDNYLGSIFKKSDTITYNDLLKLSSKDLEIEELIGEDRSKQLAVIGQFFNYQKYNQVFAGLARYLNFDTAKVGSLMEQRRREYLRNEILETGIISEEELAKLDQESIISRFNNGDMIKGLFGKFMPSLMSTSHHLYRIYGAYLSDFSNYSKKGARNLPTQIERDFLYSIVYNFGERAKNGHDLLTGKKVDGLAMKTRMLNFKRGITYKTLAEKYPVLKDLLISTHEREADPDIDSSLLLYNIQLVKSANMSLVEKESIIYQFDQLLNADLGVENQDKVKQLLRDIFDIGLAQSGFSDSFISFRDLIPISYYAKDFEQAIDKFNSLTPKQTLTYDRRFNALFPYNNPSYFPILGISEEGAELGNDNNSSQRAKFYKISMNDIIADKEFTEFTEVKPEVAALTESIEQVQEDEPLSIGEATYARKKVEFQTVNSEGQPVILSAYKVKIEGQPNIDLYVTNEIVTQEGTIQDKKYYVIDGFSGKIVSNSGATTIKQALIDMRNKINSRIKDNFELLKSIGFFTTSQDTEVAESSAHEDDESDFNPTDENLEDSENLVALNDKLDDLTENGQITEICQNPT